MDTLRIGNIGWSGTAVHAVRVGNHEPYAICAYDTGRHYRIGRVTNLRDITATTENVTCKKCLTRLEVAA